MYYNGRFKSVEKHNEYIGGSFEYFDAVDLDKLRMIEMWSFLEEIGFKDIKSFRFWHKSEVQLVKANTWKMIQMC